MIRFCIYIVDDEESFTKGVMVSLKKDYRLRAFFRAEPALEEMKKDPPDLVLLDICLPGMSGIEALERIRGMDPDILVIMVTAYEDIQSVVSAMKLGAHDYIVKPIHMDSLRVTVRNALETLRMRKEIQVLQEQLLRENLPPFIGESHATQDVMKVIDKVAKSPDTPILIVGESGTGKELIAKAIHYRSPLYNGPFVPLNCAAVPRDLIESELFGYERGAFSGASASGKRGLVEEASGGTLFLDEVGDLSLEAQAKLLRFLDSGEYYRVGGTRIHKVKSRVVSATNKDLERMIQKGRFREDLYWRLAVVKVEVPSLNERRDDILPLARHFLHEFSRKHGRHYTDISPEAEDILKHHHWKGNVRELRNVIERAVLLGEGPVVEPWDLGMTKPSAHTPSPFGEGKEGFPPMPEGGVDLAALERHYIQEALRKAGGNAVQAAKLLSMSYYAFRYRLKKLKE
jgi:DNA-binding NtrC family response regulator